jgi:two-component system nitrogen regulation sensor histidine kinase GlnL
VNDEALISGFEAFDLLATMVAVASPDGRCLRANSTLEDVIGVSRRALQRGSVLDWIVDPAPLRDTLQMVARNEVASGRFDAAMKRHPTSAAGSPELPVHVIVTPTDRADRVLVELIEVEQQTRLDREERALGLAQANKELVRNLAHEIKNPLGGIRGAAQLLAMEVTSKELTEYTQVIIHEADRLQALVDRLLAPHRRPHVVGDVNIHEICERVRSLVLAEYPRGCAWSATTTPRSPSSAATASN